MKTTEEMRARVSAPPAGPARGFAAEVARRKRLGLPLRIPVPLADGRQLLIQKADNRTMTCRQANTGAELKVGEVVGMQPDKDGSQIRMEVKRRRVGSGGRVLFDLLVLGRFAPEAKP